MRPFGCGYWWAIADFQPPDGAIVDPTLGAGPEAPVTGRVAAMVMELVDRALSR